LVFASCRDLKGNELHTNFNISSNGEAIRFLNKDNSVIETATVPALGPDQAYARLPNGSGAFTVVTQPSPAAVNINTPVAPNPDAVNITINELVTNNVNNTNLNLVTYPGGNQQDWIELYNKGSVAVNLQGLKLADVNNTWILPARTMNPGQYLLIFASGQNLTGTELHTNFTMSATQGTTIRFLNKDNTVIESVTVGSLNADQAFARLPNGTGSFSVVTQPSPAAANINSAVLANPDAANITVNEVVSDNVNNLNLNTGIYPGGSHQDWIELYNKGTVAVNLQGLKLADKSNTTWVLPDHTMNPGDYLLIFASGLNLTGTELHTNFSISSTQGDMIQFLNKNNAVIESVVVPPLAPDQSYARIPNGTGSFVIDTQPTPAAANTNAPVVPNPNAANITINELLIDNVNNVNLNLGTYPGGDRKDWIELFNKGSVAVDLGGMKLQDSQNTTWVFPSRTMNPGDYLVVFASGLDLKGSELHTNFALSSTGETVRLLNKDNAVVQSITSPVLGQDISMARLPNGTGTGFGLTTQPTPGALNASVKLRMATVQDGLIGIVSMNPGGPNCPTITGYPVCKEYLYGGIVTLSPNLILSRTRFAGCSLAQCPGTGLCPLVLTANETVVTATFSGAVQMMSPQDGTQLYQPNALLSLDQGSHV